MGCDESEKTLPPGGAAPLGMLGEGWGGGGFILELNLVA